MINIRIRIIYIKIVFLIISEPLSSSRKRWGDEHLDMPTFLIILISNNFIYCLYTKDVSISKV